ncbi:MAG: hypothetical protein TREMPRED_002003 [Tremellales sp. Tagirdzhanova-0007]|nr:MAG: hypothetical protein TREMPRED_002003 [Tremellales sp. Tagirdzhanova-0007]
MSYKLASLVGEVKIHPTKPSARVPRQRKAREAYSQGILYLVAAWERNLTVLALAYLFKCASVPFITLLNQWVGLSDSNFIDEGTKSESQPWADLGIARSGQSTQDGTDGVWEYHSTGKKMADFIPKEARARLFEAGRSQRLLKEASGGHHPLCRGSGGIEARWVWGDQGQQVGPTFLEIAALLRIG